MITITIPVLGVFHKDTSEFIATKCAEVDVEELASRLACIMPDYLEGDEES